MFVSLVVLARDEYPGHLGSCPTLILSSSAQRLAAPLSSPTCFFPSPGLRCSPCCCLLFFLLLLYETRVVFLCLHCGSALLFHFKSVGIVYSVVLEKVWSGGDSGSRFLGLVSGVSIVFDFRFSEVRWLSLSFPFPVVLPTRRCI
jgi:hypothetical protein